jgi:hypothetical protein
VRRRHTRSTDPDLYGPAVQRAVRIPEIQIDAVQSVIARGVPDIHTVTDAIIDALWLWLYENERVAPSNGHAPRTAPEAVSKESWIATVPASEPEETPEPTAADRPYSGTQDRPKWADVDPSVLDGST